LVAGPFRLPCGRRALGEPRRSRVRYTTLYCLASVAGEWILAALAGRCVCVARRAIMGAGGR
jgi:hypothetical protein